MNRATTNVARAALRALAGMGADAKPALGALVKLAVSALADADKETLDLLGTVLRLIGPEAVPALAERLKDGDAQVRARAARALAAMSAVAATAVPELIELSKSAIDSDAEAGFAALEAIGAPAYPLAAPHLCNVLIADLFADRRKWAAYALGGIGVPPGGDARKIMDALQSALLDADESVCRAAHTAMVKIGPPALPRLRELLKLGEGEASYWWAVRVLARMKADPDEVIPRLIQLTRPGVEQVKEGAFAERGSAAELLGNYAPARAEMIPALLRVLGDREDYVARAAMRSLALFGPQAIEPLKKLLRDRNPLLRRRALSALQAVRGE